MIFKKTYWESLQRLQGTDKLRMWVLYHSILLERKSKGSCNAAPLTSEQWDSTTVSHSIAIHSTAGYGTASHGKAVHSTANHGIGQGTGPPSSGPNSFILFASLVNCSHGLETDTCGVKMATSQFPGKPQTWNTELQPFHIPGCTSVCLWPLKCFCRHHALSLTKNIPTFKSVFGGGIAGEGGSKGFK